MNKQITIGLFIVLALLGGFFGWVFAVGTRIGAGWSGLAPVWLFVVGGALVVGLLGMGLMRLAFQSSRRGYDKPTRSDR